ncbi:hypothetical protein MIDIC_50010 [Alphaproteobacteria bacterium]
MFYVYVKHRRDFKDLLLYDRFVAVLKRILPILCCLLQCITGEVTVSNLWALHPLRHVRLYGTRHKVFVELLQKVKQAPVGFMA